MSMSEAVTLERRAGVGAGARRRLQVRRLRLTCLIAALLVLPGCFIFGSPGPSAVGQGKKYTSGNPSFDRFFSGLFRTQLEMAKAPDDEHQIVEKLAAKVGLAKDATLSAVLARVKRKADGLVQRGVGLKLVVTEESDTTDASAALHVAGQKAQEDEQAFVAAVQHAAEDALQLILRMRKTRRNLDEMRAVEISLEPSVGDAFRLGGPSKKAEVRKNLRDAGTLIPLMIGRAGDVSDDAHALLAGLIRATNTDHGQFDKPPPPPEEPSPEPKKARRKKRPKARGASVGAHRRKAPRAAHRPASTAKTPDFEP